MARTKSERLPKDFESQLEAGDLESLKRVFEKCAVNARKAGSERTALGFDSCSDDLTRWLVAQGADIEATDAFGDTPLASRARSWRGRLEVLVELGADVNSGIGVRETPLHSAARGCNASTAAILLRHGAHVDAPNGSGTTPLTVALRNCSNASIERLAPFAALMLSAGAHTTPEMPELVKRIGTRFEFHRAGFDPDSVAATSDALEHVYALFGVEPVPRRVLHDSRTPIVATRTGLREQHSELWDLLVPSSGPAATVQGEVIRIAGKITDELYRNGGGNWDSDFKAMADTFATFVASGTPLASQDLAAARSLVAAIKRQRGEPQDLCDLAVKWVNLNPQPIDLPEVDYRR